ncbi:MAG TPA: tRNA (N(6)-L-threonylcarbamoyladenosine(37)-C(2))-methylthiotransferase MtaB [Anaerolineaceae bacterium]|nr:tRNA (N(6)-L-threonylcarbamoyladenosine(37)-C(2))-methylthiotransferase MtaB [Anaerolineaceae bacterium]
MKIFLDSIGCRLNQSEIEKMGSQFRAAGHTLVDSPLGADLVVVNTCAVTAEAASDSRQKIRQASRSGQAEIVVTGCWSTLSPEEAAALPGVKRVVSNEAKDHLVSELLYISEEVFDREPLSRQPLPGLHLRTRAFIKVQDGCDNHCTFCITRLARGKGRSRSIADITKDIRAALEGGAQEIVLTGVHLGSWGQDFETPLSLRGLVEAILEQTNPARLRLSSLEPWDLDEQFFTLWQDNRMCRHLHLPLQSGSAAILRRMRRKTSPALFSRLVEMGRAVSEEMAITTDIIVGFPGEGEAEFTESLAFVQEMDFANGHVFSYSARPGTPAARFSNQVAGALRKQRSIQMRAALALSAQTYRQRFVGCELPVLWEATDSFGPQGWRLQGLTDNYLRVEAQAPKRIWNQISRVRLESITAEGLAGKLIPETASAPYPQ